MLILYDSQPNEQVKDYGATRFELLEQQQVEERTKLKALQQQEQALALFD
ncbi:hypothetical protein LZ480_19425 [Solibacillus sp. MA9]|uniref:Uncharacterized protein n=1 Tax=Solibacillus palustris TaxID=2908203 RepID=A0ABS9UI66_9BACL|nr:hypothetical protein [Solibacillus sp. MA9]MCH7324036.1 hypothetical protein [Solibacillus sp. MA9]